MIVPKVASMYRFILQKINDRKVKKRKYNSDFLQLGFNFTGDMSDL